jgi:hypothetical protein
VFDGFFGTGIAGVVAQMCGNPDGEFTIESYGKGDLFLRIELTPPSCFGSWTLTTSNKSENFVTYKAMS